MTESYMQKYYRTNKKFREKQKKRSLQWHKDHRELVNERSREWYANRTPEQIEDRKKYLKNLRKH